MNAYIQILDIVKTSLDDNTNINTVVTAEEMSAENSANVFPLAEVIIETGELRQQVTFLKIRISCVDILTNVSEIVEDKFYGGTNREDIYNEMLAACRSVFDDLVNDKYTKDIVIVGVADIEKVENKKDGAIGWAIDFDIEVQSTVNRI